MSRTKHHNKHKFRNCESDEFGNHNWLANEPKILRNIQKHRKRRHELSGALREALEDPEGDWNMPLDSRPWIYYW